MANAKDVGTLLNAVEDAVTKAIEYFQGPGTTSKVVIDKWGPREVLCHFLFWHEATARGMESVAGGGKPFQVEAELDETNAEAVTSRTGLDMSQLIAEARDKQVRLVTAARSMGNLDQTVLVNVSGNGMSGRQLLERIAHHWTEHIEELSAAAGS